jgi:hypothetical protein
VPVDRRATVTVGVPAEEREVVRVDVGLPEQFRLDDVVASQYWTGRRAGESVRFEGGPLAPYSCVYFSLNGTATDRGKLVFPLTVHLKDGGTERLTGEKINDPRGAQLVFAGTQPRQSDYFGVDGGGTDLGVIGAVLVTIGVVGIAAAVLLRRYVIVSPPRRARGRRPAPPGRGPRGSGSSRRRTRTPQRSRRR